MPYARNLKEHASFAHLFKPRWVEQVKESLRNHLKNHNNSIFGASQLEKMMQTKDAEIGKLRDENARLGEVLRGHEFSRKETLIEAHTKWAQVAKESLEVARKFASLLQPYNLKQDDKKMFSACLAKLDELEKFLSSTAREASFDESHNQVPSQQGGRFVPLDFAKLKTTLQNSRESQFVAAALQALRVRIARGATPLLRREAVIQISSADALSQTFFNSMIEKKSKMVTDSLIALINAVSSEYLGRSYLIENP